MTEIWLVRHGATDWNLQGRYQGQADIPLNSVGLEQARAMADKLATENIVAIYSSSLQRARQTAQALADRVGLPVHTDPRLQEVSLGKWEGQLFTDIHQRFPELIAERRANPIYFRPPDGETVAEVVERAVAAVNEIASAHPEGPVVIVSHGLTLATLICLARQHSLRQSFDMLPPNAIPEKIEWSLERQPIQLK